MNRILLMLAVIFLVSCSNSKKEASTDETKDNKAAEQSLVDSIPEVDEDITVLHPGGQEQELGVSEGGKDMNQEIGRMFRQATSDYDQGDFQAGIQLFEKIIEKDPYDGRAYYNLGIGYFKENDLYASVKAFTGAININPRDSLSLQYRGKVYYILEDFKNCLRDYELVIKLKPNDPTAYFNRGTVKGRINDYSGAIDYFTRAIELKTDYDAAYINRGIAKYRPGGQDIACFEWSKGLRRGHYLGESAYKSYR